MLVKVATGRQNCPSTCEATPNNIGIFVPEIHIWNVNCTQATALIFEWRMDVFDEQLNFFRQEMSRTNYGMSIMSI